MRRPFDPWVVVPVRGEAAGKSRLAPALDRGARMRLNRQLLGATLEAIEQWQGTLARCILVSACARTRAGALARGALVLREPMPRRGLNYAAAIGLRWARRQGARRVLILPVDLVLLRPASLHAIARAAGSGARAAIAPDCAGSGTNALLLPAGARFHFAFGADSFARHVETLRAHGYTVAVRTDPGLCFDLDTPQQLTAIAGAGRRRTFDRGR